MVLGDQPGVDRTVIDLMAEAWRAERGAITLASYRQRLGHPMVFDRSIFDALAALQGDKAAWKLVDAHPEWTRAVPLDCPYPFDINTWEEYEVLLKRGGV